MHKSMHASMATSLISFGLGRSLFRSLVGKGITVSPQLQACCHHTSLDM
jgi:uncharacterized membrane protein YdjX (TVP38/TMEM64 family)